MDYAGGVNDTFSDSITDGYVTAPDTSYLSVLDAANVSELNENFSTPKHDGNFKPYSEEANDIDENGQDIMVFSVDNSDEYYGIQVIQDEHGNLQKYQFKLQSNPDGQLEALPDTIRLLSFDTNEPIIPLTNDEGENEAYDQSEQKDCNVITTAEELKELHIDHDETIRHHSDFEEDTTLQDCEGIAEEAIETKIGIIEECNIKQELLMQDSQKDTLVHPEYVEASDPSRFQDELNENVYSSEAQQNPESAETSNLSYCNEDDIYLDGNISNDCDQDSEPMPSYETIYIKDPSISTSAAQNQTNHEQLIEFVNDGSLSVVPDPENDSENDDYQIVDGMHVTGDVDDFNSGSNEIINEKTTSSLIQNESILQCNLSQNTIKSEVQSKENNRSIIYYIVRNLQKENLNTVTLLDKSSPVFKPVKVNPRSILKSSFITPQLDDDIPDSVPVEQLLQENHPVKLGCRKPLKKSEEHQFMNFINRTTIPQVPVRTERLPRKQKIRPVQRMDEEIIVQEVVVSSNGSIETLEDRAFNKEPLQIGETVVLSDSDEGSDKKQGANRKKRKYKKHKQKIDITISDTSDDEEVIEIYSDDDKGSESEDKSNFPTKRGRGRPKKEKPVEQSLTPVKRRRGRPPKNPGANSGETEDDSETPSKKSRTDESDDSPQKEKILCPECSEPFATQNSLNTHLQHHKLENRLTGRLRINNQDDDPSTQNDAPSTIDVEKKSLIEDGDVAQVIEPAAVSSSSSSFLSSSSPLCLEQSSAAGTSKIPVPMSVSSSKPVRKLFEYNHRCDSCKKNFKNSILLKRHVCSERPKIVCPVCKESFPDSGKLNIHKRVHLKKNLVQSTSTVSVAPRRSVAVPSSSNAASSETVEFKKPPSLNKVQRKCDECGKVCSSLAILKIHKKSHKHYTCASCNSTFLSRVLLDSHKREKCVKVNSSPREKPQLNATLSRRPSFRIRKSFVASPARSFRRSMRKSIGGRSSRAGKLPPGTNVSNLETPSKKTPFKQGPAHRGIPAGKRLTEWALTMNTRLNAPPN